MACVHDCFNNAVKMCREIYEPECITMTIKFGNNKHFSGYFDVNTLKTYKAYIKEVMYYNPATIVIWNDGTKTVSKCREGDEYSPECGLILCILKKLVGATSVKNIFDDWVVDSDYRGSVTVKDVRKKHKASEKKISGEVDDID